MNKQMFLSAIVRGHLSLSRLREGVDAKLSYLSVEHMSSLRDGSTWIRQ